MDAFYNKSNESDKTCIEMQNKYKNILQWSTKKSYMHRIWNWSILVNFCWHDNGTQHNDFQNAKLVSKLDIREKNVSSSLQNELHI